MRKYLLIIIMCTAQIVFADSIGQWKAYMAYGEITDIEPAGDMVYVLSSNSIFSYNLNDESVATYDKVYPLNNCTITNIAWNSTLRRLIIIYDNYNIDLMDKNGDVYNIYDYYNKSMTEDKTVNNVVTIDRFAYLCTGFGILKVDMSDPKIAETYNIKQNVTHCTIKDGYFYANTKAGKYRCSMNDNMLDADNWQPTQDNVSFASDNDITVSSANGYKEYIVYDKYNKCYWSNEKDGKMQSYTLGESNVRTVTRSGIGVVGAPKYNHFGFLKIHDNKLYSCNGGMWDGEKPASIQVFDQENDSWTTYSNEGISEKYGIQYKDILTLDVDPRDSKRVMAGAQTGLFEFYDGELVNRYNHENSPIYFVSGLENNVNYEVVSSMFFQNNGDLLIANGASGKDPVMTLDTSGNWTILDKAKEMPNSANLKIMGLDSKGRLWMYSDYWDYPAVYRYDVATDNLYEYSNFINEDNVPYTNIFGCRSLAEDKEGNIWVGLSVGLFVLTKEYQDDPSKGFYQVKVPRNDGTNYADYLLTGLDISSIIIDNANRKWVGTHGDGVYLISADNMVEEHHFTSSNSKLLSDDILYLAMDNVTGKVYIGTDKGLCSYQSEASQTNEEMNTDNIWAYPNPVTPEYSGMITVTGLSYNADVKITTSNGKLVAQGRSTGGSFQWDGNDLNGNRVASGIYMVNTATANGEKGTVCKIAIVR